MRANLLLRLCFYALFFLLSVSAISSPTVPKSTLHSSFVRRKKSATCIAPSKSYDQFLVPGKSVPGVHLNVTDSYAGMLPASTDGKKSYFFWFYPADAKAKGQDDLIIWIDANGCSSLQAMIQENGPWLLPMGGTGKPIANKYSFTRIANVLYVDFPSGIGFSTGPLVDSTTTASHDFFEFLSSFFQMFGPLVQGKRLWFSGEGLAASTFSYILRELVDYQSNDTTINATYQGFAFINPFWSTPDFVKQMPAVDFAVQNKNVLGLNDTFLKNLQGAAKFYNVSNIIKANLVYPASPNFVDSTDNYGEFDPWGMVREAAEESNSCLNILKITDKCPAPKDPLGFGLDDLRPSDDNFINNTPGFRKAIHVSPTYSWEVCGPTFSTNDIDLDPPAASTNLADILIDEGMSGRNVVVSGEDDFLVLADGTALVLQYLQWGNKQGFDNPPTKPFNVNGKQVGKYTTERGLTFVRLPHVGHLVGAERPEIAFAIHQYLLGQNTLLA